jgi:NAD(P)H-dependent FMN reductase
MSKQNILIIEGSTRIGRYSMQVALWLEYLLSKNEKVLCDVIDPLNLKFSEGVKDPIFSQATKQADAFIIVSPEYNHSFPGTLKMLLDTELANYKYKPVLIVGVSSGQWGGVRVIEHLLPVTRRLGMIATISDLQIPYVEKEFSLKKNNFQYISGELVTKAEKQIQELIYLISLLKAN